MAFNIPIPSHSHLFDSHSLPSPFPIFFDLFPFPWDSHGIPGPIGNPIPMHISTDYLMQQQVFIEHEQMHGDCMDQLIRNPLPE